MSDVVTPASGSLLTGLKVTTAVVAIGIVVQAWLGSTGLFQGEPGRIDIHAMLGNMLFLLAVIQIGLALYAMQQGLTTRNLLIVTVITALLMTAQIGLGYGTRDSVNALAWHLPTGVALMGCSTVAAVMAFQPRLTAASE